MKHIDLFSGIGGFALAARWVGWETVGFCEPDEYCCAVLRKHWPGVPIHPDVRELTADAVGHADIVTGGYPCQPFSLAGKRGGADDDRHLWPAMFELLRELRPAWVVGENVAGHISMGLDDVLSDLEGIGYSARPFGIPAVAVDAKHRRMRVWVVAHYGLWKPMELSGGLEECWDGIGLSSQDLADSSRHEQGRQEQRPERERARQGRESEPISDDDRQGSTHDSGRPATEKLAGVRTACCCDRRAGKHAIWLPEPDVGRVAHGIPARVDRLRALGNAIVPQVAHRIFEAIDEVNRKEWGEGYER